MMNRYGNNTRSPIPQTIPFEANVYDFVPIDYTVPPVRKPPVLHHKFDGLAGQIACRLTTETPIFIPEAESPDPKKFITRNGLPIIPGSSLKGLLRNLVETVGNGCFLLFDGTYERHRVDYSKKLHPDFQKCKTNDLCIACRMFGMLDHGNVFQGNVSISDATTLAGQYKTHPAIYTRALMEPKPRHKSFYLDSTEKYLAGRKFYFHNQRAIQTDQRKTDYNQYVTPLNKGSVFTFTVSFTNLREDEFAALLYAIVLEPNVRHKIGLAKPLGLGSVKIEATEMTLIDYRQRYSLDRAAPVKKTDAACKEAIEEYITPYTSNTTSQTLQALRRIWKWDTTDRTNHAYPDQKWFRAHSSATLNELHQPQGGRR